MQMLALVNKENYRKFVLAKNKRLGSVVKWRSYENDHQRLDKLPNGGRLFLVSVPPREPKQLLLLAVYEEVGRRGGYPYATAPNRIPISDISHLRDSLRFDNGIGLRWRDGKMALALQTPRILSVADVRLLEHAIEEQTALVLSPLHRAAEEISISIPAGQSETEKARLREECSRLARDQALRPAVIALWGPACAACGLELSDFHGDYEVEVAHIIPVADHGDDSSENTLPLCRTHHWAFDRHLWSIEPATLRLHVAPSLHKNPAFFALLGRKLPRIPKPIDRATLAQACDTHWRKFRRVHRRRETSSSHLVL